jgi:hypothetical protein
VRRLDVRRRVDPAPFTCPVCVSTPAGKLILRCPACAARNRDAAR